MELAKEVETFSLTPIQFLGIPLALLGAVFLSFGAQYQSRGVNKVERLSGQKARKGLNRNQIWSLLKRPSWVIGTLLLGMAVVLQLSSLTLSPLIVVQPLGVVALVITAILNSRLSGVKLNHKTRVAIAMCVIGVCVFVTIAAFTASDLPVTEGHLVTILIILGFVLVLFLLAFIFLRHRMRAMFYIVGAGVVYGFVATLAKVVIGRIQQSDFNLLTLLCLIALIAAAVSGMYFVQNAYSSGPPDLVIAGLTVIDPLVAVFIGIVVLGEAAFAPLWAIIGFIIAGSVAIVGVIQLAKHHPQVEANGVSTH
ncbi:DMT family transporter [Lysinibacter sp. HNR]|nr:DMT family transporter [Lysinibacter sp. HNR]WGD38616.1 DMT family transporter [Lysinibacter sp. HNR]